MDLGVSGGLFLDRYIAVYVFRELKIALMMYASASSFLWEINKHSDFQKKPLALIVG